jgi:hypothetical protein
VTTATIYGAPEGFDALLLIRRAKEHAGTLLHVARHEGRMRRLAELLAFFAPEIEVLLFPAWDCLPYDRVSPNPSIVSERIATLTRLLEPATGQRIVITTVNAAVQKVPPQLVFLGESLDVKAGGTIRPEKLIAYLESHGYGRADTVMEPGEYAVRGGIIDIFPSGEGDPVRLDLLKACAASTPLPSAAPKKPNSSCFVRFPRSPWTSRASRASAPNGASCSARAPPTIRSTRRFPRVAAILAWNIGCRCSMRAWKRCWITWTPPPSRWTTSLRRR